MNCADKFVFPPLPTELVFGFGTVGDLPARIRALGASRPLVVSDPGLQQVGLVDKVTAVLAAAGVGYVVYAKVPQDSSTTVVQEAADLLQQEGCDAVVGLGGGSALDTAKAIAIAGTNPDPITAYAGLDKVEKDPLPVICLPTTAGTGSEVSFWSVVTDDTNQLKIGIGGTRVFPKVAICDPDLTVDLPPHLTASTGMDALTHAIESYVNTVYQPVSSALALQAIEFIGLSLREAVANGENRLARYNVLLGSTLAGIAMNPTRLGISHALAMPLGSWDLKIPHGIANAICLPYVMEFNVMANYDVFADVAAALGEPVAGLSARQAAEASVVAVQRLIRDIGITQGLGSFGLTRERIPAVVEEAMKSGNVKVNPRCPTAEDIVEICVKAL